MRGLRSGREFGQMNSRSLSATLVAIIVFCGALVSISSPSHAQDFKYLLWQKKVADKITTNQRYPRSAVRKGIEGTAQVRIKVKQDGTILGFEVLKSSGADVLDREIGRLMTRINPLPAVPGDKKEVFLTMPMSWTLKK